MQSAIADSFLPDIGPVDVKFLVTDRLELPTVAVSVTFSAAGLKQLRPDGSLTVNGTLIQAQRLQKQGYWYTLEIPRANRYELVYRRSAGSPLVHSVIAPRKFVPALPAVVSKKAGVRIRYDGPAIVNREVAMAMFKFPEASKRNEKWGFTVKGKVDGNEIVFAPTELREIRQGQGSLMVGVSCEQQSDKPDHKLVYAVGMLAPVEVMD
jgi:hypothetical protein